jgi:hypothetical protein
MARQVTVTLQDGTKHTYANVPDNVTPDAITARARNDFSQDVSNIDGGRTAPAKPKQESFTNAAGRALWNVPMSTAETLKGVMMTPVELGKLAFTDEGHQRVKSMYDQAAGVLTGGLQHVRDMSAPEYRGSAPAMDTSKFDKFAGDVQQNYGSAHKIASRVADNPAGAALAVAAIADPALRVAGVRGGLVGAADRGLGATADAAARTLTSAGAPIVDNPLTRKVGELATAERRGNAVASTMRTEATDTFKAAQADATATKTAAKVRADRAAKLAEIARKRGRTLDERRSAALADAAPVEPDIGASKYLSEQGDQVREPAVAKQGEIEQQMQAADAKYRAARDELVNDREAAGVGVSDTQAAKILVKKSRELVKPDPVKRPEVGFEPAKTAGGGLHEKLLEVLEPREVPLTVKEAQTARRAGIKVNAAPDGSFTRTVKPGFKDVDDFRRYLGKVLDGSVEGYEAINRVEAQQMYGNLNKVLDQYARGAHAKVQANWREGKAALEPYERVRAGQAVVGMQPGTSTPNVPAANIPGRIIAGGRDTVQQASAVAGKAPVAATVRSQVQNAFKGAKSAAEAEALVGPNTSLGDIVNADPALRADVRSYITRVKAQEAAAAKAADLESRAASAAKRAKGLDSTSEAAQAEALKASQQSQQYQRELASLELADPAEVGSQYTRMIEQAQKEGRITPDQYKRGLVLAKEAKKAFKTKTQRDYWIKRAVAYVGLGYAGTKVIGAVKHLGE